MTADVLNPKRVCVLRLSVDTRGARFDSSAGEIRSIVWSQTLPRDVQAARAQQPIDWGGCMVRSGDYVLVFDGLYSDYKLAAKAAGDAT